MLFGLKKSMKFYQILPFLLGILLIIVLFVFVIESIEMASQTNKNTFTYIVKVRGTLEDIDKIFERSEVNVNVLSDTITNTYDTNRQHDKKYNLAFIKEINGLVQAVLSNSPSVNGAWFQMNADLPFSASAYNWYEFKNNEFINLNENFKDTNAGKRKITPEDDPYYFNAITSQKTTWSDLYTDADTKVSMITVSQPVYKNGVIIGVAGVDIATDNLQQALQNMQLVFYNSELFLLNDKYDIILSQFLSDSHTVKHNYPFLKLFKDDNKDGMVEYYEDGIKKTAVMMALTNNYNIVITFEDKDLFVGTSHLFNTIYVLFAIMLVLGLIALSKNCKTTEGSPKLESKSASTKGTKKMQHAEITLIKDKNGVYTDCNPQDTAFLEISTKDFIGKTDSELFSQAEMTENLKYENAAISTRKEQKVNFSYTNISEESFDLEKSITPLFDANGEVISLLITYTNK